MHFLPAQGPETRQFFNSYTIKWDQQHSLSCLTLFQIQCHWKWHREHTMSLWKEFLLWSSTCSFSSIRVSVLKQIWNAVTVHFKSYFTHCIFPASHTAGLAWNAGIIFHGLLLMYAPKVSQSTQRVHNPVQTVKYSRHWSLCPLGVAQLASTPCRHFTSAVRYSRIAAL